MKFVRGAVVLRNVPRTAITSDVRRMLEGYKIENVQNVHLDYHRFMATTKAYVTFTDPAFALPASLRLKSAKMSGMALDTASTVNLDNVWSRSRGSKGREEAMARGALTGNGPDAGVGERGKGVVIWGLPGKMTAEKLTETLRGFRLASTGIGRDVFKLQFPGRPTMTSRHYVRTASASEAHRIVRRLHMTPLNEFGRQYTIRARIIY